MSSKGGHIAAQAFRMLLVATLKLLAIALAFTCRVIALVLSKISHILEKATGYGSNH